LVSQAKATRYGTINDRDSSKHLGPVFHQEGQSASADRNYQIGGPSPIFVSKKIPLPLLLLLARKASYIEELTVKFDTVFAADFEGRPDGLIHDDIGWQQPLVRVEHKYAWQRRFSLRSHACACPRHYREHCGAKAKKSHNAF
jgi:hypothetical protein